MNFILPGEICILQFFFAAISPGIYCHTFMKDFNEQK